MEKKIYEITVRGSIEDCDKENESLFKEVVKVHKINTLEEYFDLYEKISELTEGEYQVANCGTDFYLWED